jgi:membrane-bound serine protease (ClpP class)
MGLAETLLLVVVLIVAAMILIVVEICTPTFGVLAVAAIAAVGWAVYLCYTINGVAGLVATISAPILMLVYTVAAVRTLPKTSLGRKIGLRRDAVAAGEGTPEAGDLGRFVGRVATAETLLRPSGFVRIDGRRIVAEAETGLIEKGRQVKVIRAGGTSVIVRKVEA